MLVMMLKPNVKPLYECESCKECKTYVSMTRKCHNHRPAHDIARKKHRTLTSSRQQETIKVCRRHKIGQRGFVNRPSTAKELGARMVSTKAVDFKEEHERQLQTVADEAEERATRELRAALKRLREEKDAERTKALKNQKEYYEKMSQRIEEQRNQYEAEKERELLKKFLKEKAAALEKQWQECEKLKEEAIAMACEALSRKLRTEFVMEKEQEIAEALRIAKEKYQIREKNAIEKTRRECEEIARREAERVHKLHQEDIRRCNERYALLEKKWLREIDSRKSVEHDFRELQDDYRRFMDYTDGMFHSDYLMQLRHLGQKLAEKEINKVNHEDIDKRLMELT